MLGDMRNASRAFIVGMHGRASNSSLDALGVCVRRITEKGIFSECWMERAFEGKPTPSFQQTLAAASGQSEAWAVCAPSVHALSRLTLCGI